MANIPKNQKALYPHIPKLDQSKKKDKDQESIQSSTTPSIPYPFKYLQKYPVSL